MKKLTTYFSREELTLWGSSAGLVLVSFFLFDRENFMTLGASLIGTTSLIYNAKGNPIGQALMILFSLLYGVISYTFSYFGEMINYLGMTGPMALFALISWLRNPYKGNHAEVAVNQIGKWEYSGMYLATAVVTLGFYFILEHFNTANIIPSTLSVATSFIAVYLTFRRSPYFALAYAANDVVLIILWILAAKEDISYLSVIICFVMFLIMAKSDSASTGSSTAVGSSRIRMSAPRYSSFKISTFCCMEMLKSSMGLSKSTSMLYCSFSSSSLALTFFLFSAEKEESSEISIILSTALNLSISMKC